MNTALSLLQAAAVLLQTLVAHPQTDTSTQNRIVATAGNAIASAYQIASQERPQLRFSMGNQYPTIEDIRRMYVIDDAGVTHLASQVVREQYTSFGDLNGDNFDDIVVIAQYAPNGPLYAVPFVNTVGSIVQKGNTLVAMAGTTITSHHVDNGIFEVTTRSSAGVEAILHFKLVKNQLKKI